MWGTEGFNPYHAIHFLVHVPNMLIMVGPSSCVPLVRKLLYSDLGHFWTEEYTHFCGLFCQDHFDTQLSGTGCLDYQPSGTKPPRQSILCHDALLVHLCGHQHNTGSHHCLAKPQSGSFASHPGHLSQLWPNVMIKYPTHVKGRLSFR